MKKIPFYAVLLSGLLALPVSQGVAAPTIQLVTTFDYPDSNVIYTEPQGINEAGDVVGYTLDKNVVRRGFVRFADGTMQQIIAPNEDNFTLAAGITDTGIICGYYNDASGLSHGYLLSNGTFTQFDVEGATQTRLSGINDAGDLIGRYYIGSSEFPFIKVGGVMQTIHIHDQVRPGGYIFPGGINNEGEFVGWYYPPNLQATPSFFGKAGVGIRYGILGPDSTGTLFYGLNDNQQVVGAIGNGNDGRSLGFVTQLGNGYVYYGYPGAATTWFTGINNSGLICGYWEDNIPHFHGIIAQLTTSAP